MADSKQHQAQVEASLLARHAAWSKLGEVDSDLLTYSVTPSLMGGPEWPNMRQAYRVFRGELGIGLGTDGLSDPFDDSWDTEKDKNGFEIELYAIADQLPEGQVAASWLWELVVGVAYRAAKYGDMVDLLKKYGTVSTELYDVPIPEQHQTRFLTEDETVGVLIGLDAPPALKVIEGPVSPIRLANIVLLTTDELAHIWEHHETGRDEIAARLAKTERPLVSSLTRASVV